MHATLHAIVEAQIALEDETPARRTAQRLMDEGLDGMMRSTPSAWCSPSTYFAALERLTAEHWRRSQ
jgi:hypothetical protein